MTISRDLADRGHSNSNPNLLINGNFDVWQRGVSFSSAGFTADRWYVTSGYTLTRNTDVPDDVGAVYSLNSVRAASTGHTIGQFIELPATGAAGVFWNGNTVTLSGYVKGAAGSLDPVIKFSTGSGGSSGTDWTRTEAALSLNGSWQPFSFTFTVDQNVGASDTSVVVYLYATDVTLSSDLRFSQIKLEEGSVATPFVPRQVGEELALCQRYYQTTAVGTTQTICVASAASVSTLRGHYQLTTELRDSPTVSCLNDQTFRVNADAADSIEFATAYFRGAKAIQFVFDTPSGFTIVKNESYAIDTAGYDTVIEFDAEL